MKQGGKGREEHFVGKQVQQCIPLQYRTKGLTPLSEVTIRDENKDSCISPQAQQQRHFSRVLNVHNIVIMQEMNGIRVSYGIRLAQEPTYCLKWLKQAGVMNISNRCCQI